MNTHNDDFDNLDNIPDHPGSIPDLNDAAPADPARTLSPEELETRLTAFALGELDPSDRAAVENLIASDAAAQSHVTSVRAAGRVLSSALTAEVSPFLDPARRRDLLDRMEKEGMGSADERALLLSRLRWMQSPSVRVFAGLSGLAAVLACGFFLIPTLGKSRTGTSSTDTFASNQTLDDKEEKAAEQLQSQSLAEPDSTQQLNLLKDEAGRDNELSGVAPTAPSATGDVNTITAPAPAGSSEDLIPGLIQGESEAFAESGSAGAPNVRSARGSTSADGQWAIRQELSVEGAYFGEGMMSAELGGGKGAPASESERADRDRRPHFIPEEPIPYRYYRTLPPNTESYIHTDDNPFYPVLNRPLSTVSTDVDTASYTNIRRFLSDGSLPPVDAVRVEEMINYFSYSYEQPTGSDPVSINTEVGPCPWNESHRLLRLGLRAREVQFAQRPGTNLVFLVDVSGSMADNDKLPLVRTGLNMMLDNLTGDDRLAIVTYAGSSGLQLPSTFLDDAGKARARAVIDSLGAGGSTNGASGIQLAYDTASAAFIDKGVNRVMLATDGDFNVGVTDRNDLIQLIENKAKSGVYLTVLGVGEGNLKDGTMEQLADKGNGQYAYLDSVDEARRVLVEQATGTLMTVAKDVKVQIEFNPANVSAYRLIGYENRVMADQDFNDDRKDAGDLGAGHTVTALYEIVPVGVELPLAGPSVDPLKYQKPADDAAKTEQAKLELTDAARSGELLTVKIRYKRPETPDAASVLMEKAVADSQATFEQSSPDFRFAAAVAQFGMLLRNSPMLGSASFESVIAQADASRASDPDGYRGEFVRLVKTAQQVSTR